MSDNSPDTSSKTAPHDTRAIVAALGARAKLGLSEAELDRLSEYVVDSWDMADRLREVATPGYEGQARDLPLRAAYSNRPANTDPTTVPQPVRSSSPQPARALAPEVVEDTLVAVARGIASGQFTPVDLVNAQLERIDQYDDVVRSYITDDR